MASVLALPAMALATPSTTYWAPSVATCQAAFVPHVTYDTYIGKDSGYPVDTGLTMGMIASDKIQAEVGYDALLPGEPTQVFLNGKICFPENALGKGMPAIGIGMYNIGFHTTSSGTPNNFNTMYVVGQKSLPIGGYLAAGVYFGLGPDTLYVNSDGEKKKAGALVGWLSPDIPVGLTGLKKLTVAADVQTGKNVLGAGGVGLGLSFTDSIGLLVGPVFYFDKNLQPGASRWFWTTQLDIDIPLGKSKTP